MKVWKSVKKKIKEFDRKYNIASFMLVGIAVWYVFVKATDPPAVVAIPTGIGYLVLCIALVIIARVEKSDGIH